MTKTLRQSLTVAAAVLLTAAPAWAAMPILEDSAEVDRLNAQVNSAGVGTITVRRCDQCAEETMRIREATKLYLGRDLLPLAKLRDYLGKGATVVFKPDEPEVVRIRLWRPAPGE